MQFGELKGPSSRGLLITLEIRDENGSLKRHAPILPSLSKMPSEAPCRKVRFMIKLLDSQKQKYGIPQS